MSELKDKLQHDLTEAIRSRDAVTSATLRMTLAAVTNEEVAGKEHRDLTDDDVLRVVTKEAKKRKEAAEAFDGAGRAELAATERAELAVLEDYLPKQLDEAELERIVRSAVAESGATGMPQMGLAMKAAQVAVSGRADGGRVSAIVRSVLSGT